MLSLYHYTDTAAMAKILHTQTMKPTEGNYGYGVYLTSLNPDNNAKERIAFNNFTSGAEAKLSKGKLDCVIEINFPLPDSRLKKCPVYSRSVYIFRGWLSLPNFWWSWKSSNNPKPLTSFLRPMNASFDSSFNSSIGSINSSFDDSIWIFQRQFR